ncbi:MAG: hypothetical protein M3139_03035, partial [Bacteroidota bacterium]|nr:hypothetical protein [Bacteroidota bacterium]
LDVFKIQSGQLHLNINEFNMNELADESIAAYQIVSNNHKIIRKGSHKSQVINGNRQRIEQVLNNLFSNAIK